LAEFGGKGERKENRPDSNYLLNTKSRDKGKRDQIFNLKYFRNIKKQDLTPDPFRISPEHVEIWRREHAKNPAKGFGTDVQGTWYWYQSWIDHCIALCVAAGNKYKGDGAA
jgi:hypothetical protein